MPVDAEKNKLQNCYLGFLKFWKCWKFWRPNFKIFKKPVLEGLSNVCTKFQVRAFINARFYSTCEKWLLFRAFGRNLHFHIFILFRFLCSKRCSKAIFRRSRRIRRPAYTCIMTQNDRNRQFDLETGTAGGLTSEEVNSAKDWRYVTDPNHVDSSVLMRLFPAFCLGKALNKTFCVCT